MFKAIILAAVISVAGFAFTGTAYADHDTCSLGWGKTAGHHFFAGQDLYQAHYFAILQSGVSGDPEVIKVLAWNRTMVQLGIEPCDLGPTGKPVVDPSDPLGNTFLSGNAG